MIFFFTGIRGRKGEEQKNCIMDKDFKEIKKGKEREGLTASDI